MANELTVTASVTFAKGNVNGTGLAVTGKQYNVTGADYQRSSMEVPTTSGGTAIPLGPATGQTLGWFVIKNNDANNYVTILTAVSGTGLLTLYPGEIAIGRFSSNITAPAAIANGAVVQIEYQIVVA